MILEQKFLPRFREADANGKIGARGYLAYFQDMQNLFMHNLGKGNDTLPESRNLCWMFTKYHIQVMREADFTKELQFTAWIEKIRASSIVQQEIQISGENGEVYAVGSLECVLFDKEKKHLTGLSDADFPMEVQETRADGGVGFTRMHRRMDGLQYRYTHKVRYTDLDKTLHMTNLKYVDLFMNAFESSFYEQNLVTDFELHYVSQCFEGEELRVSAKQEESGIQGLQEIRMNAVHADDSVAAQAKMVVKKRETDLCLRKDS